MKKIACLLITVFCFVPRLFSVDFGFLLTNDTCSKNYGSTSFYISQENEVSAWVKIPFGGSLSHYLAAEGMYRFEYNDGTGFSAHYLDVSLLKYAYRTDAGSGVLKVNAGRFFFSDLTSRIFAQNADGIFASFESSAFSVGAYASYTGLLNANVVKMLDADDFDSDGTHCVYSLADKYVNAVVTASFPLLFAGQTLSVQGAGSFRLSETAYHRMYATAELSGEICRNLMYDVCASAAFKLYGNEPLNVSPFVKGTLQYYFSKTALGFNMVFAGNDFSGVTSLKAYNSALEPEYTAFLKTGIFASVKPNDILLFEAGIDTVFDGTKNYRFKGIQYELDLGLQVAGDVFFGMGWTHYIDRSVERENYMEVSLKAKVAL